MVGLVDGWMNAYTVCAICAIFNLHSVLRVNFYYDKIFTRHSLALSAHLVYGFYFQFVCSLFLIHSVSFDYFSVYI